MSARTALRGSFRQHLKSSLKVGRPSPNERLEVTLVLRRKQQPQHPWSLDQYLSHEELAAVHGAFLADIEAVEEFASEQHFSVTGVDQAARTMTLSGLFGDLTSVFNADVELHRLGDKTFRSRRGHLHVPPELAGRVIAVLGFDTRPNVRSLKNFRPLDTGGDASYTAKQVAELYNFPKNASGKNQTIALIELGGGYRTSDLKAYWKKLGLDGVKVSSVSVDGAANRAIGNAHSADSEVVLDIEVAGTVAPKAKLAVYFGPNTDQGFFNALNAAIHDRIRKPSVISISWGGPENEWPRQTLDVFNQALHDAALLGITVFCAAGDSGSSDGETDGKPHVDFPASSPWVVACGGTSIQTKAGAITGETAWNDGAASGATGGGVSTFFAVPDYQASARVPISTVRPKFAGRGVPDVAGHADPETGYFVFVDGTAGVVGGTSAVAPLWAGLTALINEQLGTRVGFINPLLYGTFAQHKALNDVPGGTNGEFAAKSGWDACTGMGSPNGQAMLDVLKQIQQGAK
jgi:kumamolisin